MLRPGQPLACIRRLMRRAVVVDKQIAVPSESHFGLLRRHCSYPVPSDLGLLGNRADLCEQTARRRDSIMHMAGEDPLDHAAVLCRDISALHTLPHHRGVMP